LKRHAILQVLAKASRGLLFVSETEAELEPFVWDKAPTLTEDNLRELAEADDDAAVEKLDLDGFFRAVSQEDKPGFEKLAETLRSQLDDIKVFKIGEVEKTAFIVGKIADGTWAGLKTTVVET
jgi:hypothetical protein